MDTSTVLEIIKMIDNKINIINEDLEEDPDYIDILDNNRYNYNDYNHGRLSAYEELSIHLQSFIEAQLSIAENSTGE